MIICVWGGFVHGGQPVGEGRWGERLQRREKKIRLNFLKELERRSGKNPKPGEKGGAPSFQSEKNRKLPYYWGKGRIIEGGVEEKKLGWEGTKASCRRERPLAREKMRKDKSSHLPEDLRGERR